MADPTKPPPDCGCAWRWGRYVGTLYGCDMGEGWLLAERSPRCPPWRTHGIDWSFGKRPLRTVPVVQR